MVVRMQLHVLTPPIDGRQSETALAIARGTGRLLQSLGFDIVQLARERHVLFMVYSATIDYARPALLNDTIGVSARLAKVGRARLAFRQEVTRSGELLASGDITLACVDARTLKPVAVPSGIRECLEELADSLTGSPSGTSAAMPGQS